MGNKVGVSTGPIYSWSNTLDGQIDILKELSPDAIEINLATIGELEHTISRGSVDYLKQLPHVSIHAPFWIRDGEDYFYKDTAQTRDIIKRVKEFYDLVDAKGVCFHPNVLIDWEVLENTGMNVCLENMNAPGKFSIPELKEAFDMFPHFNMVLDTAHALSYDVAHLHELINNYKRKIQYVHFSDRRYALIKDQVKDHQTFFECSAPAKFKKVKELDCPIIIEISLKHKKNDIGLLKKEITCVREYFRKL